MEIFLHLGAHKTATTYIQRRLKENEALLAQQGISFIPPGRYRPAIAKAAARRKWLNPMQPTREHRRQKVLADLYSQAGQRGDRRFVLSEENLIGTPERILSGTWFYDHALEKVAAATRFAQGNPVRALLAIRNYADFFPSAYAESIKLAGFVPFDEPLRARYLAQVRGWPEVISDIAAGLPDGSSLVVWQYEAMRPYETLILEQLVGSAVVPALAPFTERPQPGASARSIAHLHRVAARGTQLKRHRIRQILRANPKSRGFPGFDPWTADERRLLSVRYEHDLKRISDANHCILLHPRVPANHFWASSGADLGIGQLAPDAA